MIYKRLRKGGYQVVEKVEAPVVARWFVGNLVLHLSNDAGQPLEISFSPTEVLDMMGNVPYRLILEKYQIVPKSDVSEQ